MSVFVSQIKLASELEENDIINASKFRILLTSSFQFNSTMIEFVVALYCIGLLFVPFSVSAQITVKPGSWELVVANGGVSK